jgi:uncharacterized membrane protein HdeD (DUF308 family)
MSFAEERELGPSPADVRQNPGWFVALGALLVVLGVIAMVAAFAATLATVLFFGVLLLIVGVVQIAHALAAARWRGFFVHLVGGILYAVVGGLIVFDPVAGAIGLTLLLAVFFVLGGILKIVLGFQGESAWFTLSGIVDLVLGLLIAIGWPGTGTWVIGLFLGIELVFTGLSLILVALAMRPSSRLGG